MIDNTDSSRVIKTNLDQNYFYQGALKRMLDLDIDIEKKFRKGMFYEVLDQLEKNYLWKKNMVIVLIENLCLKEIGEFKKALSWFMEFPACYLHPYFISAVQIGCCYILQGDVQKGLEMIVKNEDSKTNIASLMDIGRALFQVGEFQKSKEYFCQVKELLSNETLFKEFAHFDYAVLDALCKMKLLAIDVLPDFVNEISFKIRLRPRLEMSACCLMIDDYHMFEASIRCRRNVEKKVKSCELLFTEPLMMAQYWKKSNQFFKALVTYRLIELYQKKFDDIPQQKDNKKQNIDITYESEYCIEQLARIFNFDASLL